VFVRLSGAPCLVIGGGTIAERKVVTLLGAQARVTVVSPTLTPRLTQLAAAGEITHWARGYGRDDVRGFRLAFAATDDESLHRAIAADAEAAGVWLNVADRPQLCSFIVPATVERGDLTIAISTGGASPALAKHLRQQLDQQFGTEYAQALAVLGAVRQRLQTQPRSPAERREILTALVHSGLLEYLRTGQVEAIDRLLGTTVGDGASISQLGVQLD